MDRNTHIMQEVTRLRLLADALELQHLTGTATNIVPIPNTDCVIVIGTLADVARAMPELRDLVLTEARDACERVQDACQERDGTKWPELRDDAATGAGDCVAAIEELRAPAAASTTEVSEVRDE